MMGAYPEIPIGTTTLNVYGRLVLTPPFYGTPLPAQGQRRCPRGETFAHAKGQMCQGIPQERLASLADHGLVQMRAVRVP
jgi:hypothetical protein